VKTKTTPTYLTQKKLEGILSQFFEIETEVLIEGTRMKSDIQFLHDGKKYAVEFDGDSHYCDPTVMQRDLRKDRLLTTQEFNVVRIPYWIQLDTHNFHMFFRFDCPGIIKSNHSHGFIDKKAKLPSHFCVNGIQKFLDMMWYMAEKYRHIFVDVLDSLNMKNYSNVNNLIPSHYGYPELKQLLNSLMTYNDVSNREKKVYKSFLSIPCIPHPVSSIENSIPCN
jgi:hypothetical protein